MKKYSMLAAIAMTAAFSAASAEPVKLSDAQLNAVVAGGSSSTTLNVNYAGNSGTVKSVTTLNCTGTNLNGNCTTTTTTYKGN